MLAREVDSEWIWDTEVAMSDEEELKMRAKSENCPEKQPVKEVQRIRWDGARPVDYDPVLRSHCRL
jgi:hypothetical protein